MNWLVNGLLLVGLALVAVGVGLMWLPLGVVVAGLACVGLAVVMGGKR